VQLAAQRFTIKIHLERHANQGKKRSREPTEKWDFFESQCSGDTIIISVKLHPRIPIK